jgi:hypothetical protein
MTFEEEQGLLVNDNDENNFVMRERAVKAWESACARATEADAYIDICERRIAAAEEGLRNARADAKGAIDSVNTAFARIERIG